MEFKEETIRRRKNLSIRTKNWEAITYRFLFKIVKWLYEEEDRRYPEGEGSKGLLKALTDLRTESVDEVAKVYGV